MICHGLSSSIPSHPMWNNVVDDLNFLDSFSSWLLWIWIGWVTRGRTILWAAQCLLNKTSKEFVSQNPHWGFVCHMMQWELMMMTTWLVCTWRSFIRDSQTNSISKWNCACFLIFAILQFLVFIKGKTSLLREQD